jgi:hypothetical protein
MMIEFSFATVTRHRRSEICQSRSGYVSTNLALRKGRTRSSPGLVVTAPGRGSFFHPFADAVLREEAIELDLTRHLQRACLLFRPKRSRH